MLTLTKAALLLLLFMLISSSVWFILRAMQRVPGLGRRPRKSYGFRQPSTRQKNVLLRHFIDLLLSSQLKLTPGAFIFISAIAGTSGIAAGSLYFDSAKGVCVLGCCMGLLPYIWLRSRLISLQFKHRIDFLPALESFYQSYILSGGRNVRATLKHAIEGDRMPPHAQKIFEQLYAGLMVHRDTATCLRVFVFALGSRWAEHFAAMLRYGLEDGADLSLGLQELITDMRRALRADHQERNRLLEIRIANFSPIVFLALFLVVNFKMDPELAYRYYALSEAGKSMLLDSILLIGASFMMGIYLSLRKI